MPGFEYETVLADADSSKYPFFCLLSLSAPVGKPLKRQIPLRQYCLRRFRVLDPCEDFVYRQLFLQGPNKEVNSWRIRIFMFLLPMKEKLFILTAHRRNFSTTDKDLSLMLTLTLVVQRFLRETFLVSYTLPFGANRTRCQGACIDLTWLYTER